MNFFQSEVELKTAIRELIERGLLQFDRESGLYDLHPIVRRYAYERLVDKAGIHSLLRDYFVKISRHDNSVPDIRKSMEELGPIIELYYHTAKMGLYDEAYRIFEKRLQDSLFYRFGAYIIISELLRALLPSGNEKNLGPKKGKNQMELFNKLALTYSNLGQPHLAEYYHNLALGLSDKFGDKSDQINCRANIAAEQIKLGKLQEAERTLQQRIEGKGDTNSRAYWHQMKGDLFAYRGDFAKASKELFESLRIYNRYKSVLMPGQNQPQSAYYAERAQYYLLKNEPQEAFKSASQCYDILLRDKKKGIFIEYAYIRAELLLGISFVEIANSKMGKESEFLDQAKIHLREALIRCRNINLAYLEPAILLGFAKWYRVNNELKKAENTAEESLNIADRCEYRLYQAEIHNFLAQLALSNNDCENAKKHAQIAYERALCGYKTALDDAKSVLDKLSLEITN